MVTSGTWIFCLATDVAVDAGKPTLLQILGRSTRGLVPEGRRESESTLVNGKGLEGIVQI
jgi:hypothetical protein